MRDSPESENAGPKEKGCLLIMLGVCLGALCGRQKSEQFTNAIWLVQNTLHRSFLAALHTCRGICRNPLPR